MFKKFSASVVFIMSDHHQQHVCECQQPTLALFMVPASQVAPGSVCTLKTDQQHQMQALPYVLICTEKQRQ